VIDVEWYAQPLLRSREGIQSFRKADFRRKIIEAIERGASKAGAARLFVVSLSSVKRYARIA
jgi:hypothetical protein